MKTIRKSIIKSSNTIRTSIKDRIKELNLTPSGIVKDAQERGIKIDSASLSKYLNKPDEVGGLSDENIIYIAIRWGVYIHLDVKMPPYDEANALKQIKIIFG